MPANREKPFRTVNISESVQPIIPPQELNLPPLNPADLFITTGDGFIKTKELLRLIEEYRPAILLLPPTPEVLQFAKQVQRSHVQATELAIKFIALRGDHTFIEVECLGDGVVKCRPVDTRLNSGLKMAARKGRRLRGCPESISQVS